VAEAQRIKFQPSTAGCRDDTRIVIVSQLSDYRGVTGIVAGGRTVTTIVQDSNRYQLS
jgi:hypothetical protein